MRGKHTLSNYRQQKGDYCLYTHEIDEVRKVVPIDIGAGEMSPAYVLRIFRQFGFINEEIESFLKQLEKMI